MYKDMYPRFKEVYISTLSGQWERIMRLKEYMATELIRLYPLYSPYLSFKQKESFSSRLHLALKNDIGLQIQKLEPKEKDNIRDISVQMEKFNILLAFELIRIAHIARPKGPFISKKYKELKEKVNNNGI